MRFLVTLARSLLYINKVAYLVLRFEFPLKQDDIAGRDLELSIKNDTSFFSSNTKEMGVVTIDLSKMDISKAATEW
jgi:hypothetical protein